MKFRDILDKLVLEIKSLGPENKMSGDDSDLPDVWEEYKYQLQIEKSFFWTAYIETTVMMARDIVDKIPDTDVETLWYETPRGRIRKGRTPSINHMREDIHKELMRRLAAKARKEKIQYKEPENEFFYYQGPGFLIYAAVLYRKGPNILKVRAYSVATGSWGEEGEIYADRIEGVLSEEAFDECRELGWPETIEELEREVLMQSD